jgi:hypothetical protein
VSRIKELHWIMKETSKKLGTTIEILPKIIENLNEL